VDCTDEEEEEEEEEELCVSIIFLLKRQLSSLIYKILSKNGKKRPKDV